MQIPTVDSVEVVLASSVGLATIGVCVFCAFTSVDALFLFGGENEEKKFVKTYHCNRRSSIKL